MPTQYINGYAKACCIIPISCENEEPGVPLPFPSMAAHGWRTIPTTVHTLWPTSIRPKPCVNICASLILRACERGEHGYAAAERDRPRARVSSRPQPRDLYSGLGHAHLCAAA